jgi:RimJ/RimL family protein N-acetyltransferase
MQDLSPRLNPLLETSRLRLEPQVPKHAAAMMLVLADPRASVAYMFPPEVWGQGYATEAVQAMLAHLKSDLQVDRVEADIDTRNLSSQRLIERLGFKRVKEVRNADEFKGRTSDEYHYELTLS